MERKIVCDAVRKFGQDVGCRGRNQQQIGVARYGNMFDHGVIGTLKHFDNHGLTRERFKRERSNKLGRRTRHDNAHGGSGLLQTAQDFGSFVRSDATGDAEENLHTKIEGRGDRETEGKSDREIGRSVFLSFALSLHLSFALSPTHFLMISKLISPRSISVSATRVDFALGK